MEPCSFSTPMMGLNVVFFKSWKKRGTNRPLIELSTIHKDWEFLGFGPLDKNNQPTPPNVADFVIRAYG